jgi:DNA mismatch repair protein MLH1
VVAQLYGSQLLSHFLPFQSSLKAPETDDADATTAPTYTSWGLCTSPSYAAGKRTTLVLFVNQRLVDCNFLKKRLEELFVSNKPFLCLSITVPPQHVDVNVHPTKRQVALLHLNDICQGIVATVKELLSQQDQSFVQNRIGTHTKKTEQQSASKKRAQPQAPDSKDKKPAPAASSQKSSADTKRIRTSRAAPAGALEPFLVSTQTAVHSATCPLATAITDSTVDLTQPGAFATAAAQCTCRSSIRLPQQAQLRPCPVLPTTCTFLSMEQLRRRVHTHALFPNKLKTACFVGVVSHHRSLIQCGDELVLLHHYDAARHLFYQLALLRFGGGAAVASFSQSGSTINVAAVVAECVQLEETLRSDNIANIANTDNIATGAATTIISDTNAELAEQVAACLYEHAELLKEQCSIVLEKQDDRVVLTGLPVLLDGYEPLPHGVPLFLLRLATEVDWRDEKSCFRGICRELGAFYAQLPNDKHTLGPFVRHTLFPAITTLLVPPDELQKEEGLVTLTGLKKLYRVFERC